MARQRKDIDYRTWMRLVEAAKWKCARCGTRLSVTVRDKRSALSSPVFPEIDHVVPFSKGGADDETNFQVLCRRCNRRKRERL